jgi:hypothetical protein
MFLNFVFSFCGFISVSLSWGSDLFASRETTLNATVERLAPLSCILHILGSSLGTTPAHRQILGYQLLLLCSLNYWQLLENSSRNEQMKYVTTLFVPGHSKCVRFGPECIGGLMCVDVVFTAVLSVSQYRSCEAAQAVGAQISATVAERRPEWHGDRLTSIQAYSKMFNWLVTNEGTSLQSFYVLACHQSGWKLNVSPFLSAHTEGKSAPVSFHFLTSCSPAVSLCFVYPWKLFR